MSEDDRRPDGCEPEERAPRANMAAIAVAFEGGLGLLALLLGWVWDIWPIPGIDRAAVSWQAVQPAVLSGLGATAPLLVGLWLMDRFPVGPLAGLQCDLERTVKPLFRECSVGELAAVSLAAGIGEEMLFRGLAQQAFQAWWGPPWGALIALIAASALFGAAHFLSVTYAILAACAGLYFGALMIWTESLVAPALTHSLYDFVALFYLVRVRWSRHA